MAYCRSARAVRCWVPSELPGMVPMTIGKALAGTALSVLSTVAILPRRGDDVVLLLPGDRSLVEAVVPGDSARVRSFQTDTAGVEREREGEDVTLVRGIPGDPHRRLLVRQIRSARGQVVDSLVVRMPGLVPESERLITPWGSNTYRYDGGRVMARLARGDSAPDTRELSYPHPVFAFNELDVLVRSLPYARGYTRVVPLFSEGDNDLEYDTLTVLEKVPETAGEPALWKVRFADKVIVVEFAVEEGSRRIVSRIGGARASGARGRTSYEYGEP